MNTGVESLQTGVPQNIKKNFFNKTEWVVFIIFLVLLCVVNFFHEPWFDEAQAWQIARCASLKDILFEIPHYEGHPALWHLMLFLPAKLGFSYELTLKAFSIVAIGLSGWLLIFKSPFPKIVKFLLPFHYFVFYQNGVISRPYGYMTLALILMAVAFSGRNDKPLKFVASMILLCMLSGFGIVLAGGIAIAWVLEICIEKEWRFFQTNFWKDRRILILIILLVIATILILQILPKSNTFAMSIQASNPIWVCLLYSFFAMIPDSTLVNVLECEGMPKYSIFDTRQFIIAIIIGLVFLILITLYSTKRNFFYFFIPYVLYSVFTSLIYFSAHHLCIIVAFLIFWFWIASLDDKRGFTFLKRFQQLKISSQDKEKIRLFGIIIFLLPVLIPVVWTIVASVHEIKYDYFNSKGIASFIKQHGLENASFIVEWGEVIDEDWTEEEYFEKINAFGLDVSINPVSVMPYFDHNFCVNLNNGDDDKAYNIHRFANAEESREVFEKLRAKGTPDGVIGMINLSKIYGEEVSMKDYVPIYKILPRYVSIWKIFNTFGDSFKTRYIYLRKDLLERYGVERVTN